MRRHDVLAGGKGGRGGGGNPQKLGACNSELLPMPRYPQLEDTSMRSWFSMEQAPAPGWGGGGEGRGMQGKGVP